LPAHFGSWKSTHQRFDGWCESGIFDRVLNYLASDAGTEYVMIDALISAIRLAASEDRSVFPELQRRAWATQLFGPELQDMRV
jgi:hypothetical protein